MKSLILVRHAEAEHLTKKLKGGWTDTQLTSKGRRQAALLAKRLAGDLEVDVCRFIPVILSGLMIPLLR